MWLPFTVSLTTAADDIHKYFFYCFSEKIRLNVSSESSAGKMIQVNPLLGRGFT